MSNAPLGPLIRATKASAAFDGAPAVSQIPEIDGLLTSAVAAAQHLPNGVLPPRITAGRQLTNYDKQAKTLTQDTPFAFRLAGRWGGAVGAAWEARGHAASALVAGT